MKKGFRALTAAFIIVAMVVSPAFASDVSVAVVDVTAPTGSVTLAPSENAPIVINMTVNGAQAGTATFEVYRNWVLTDGTFAGSSPEQFTVGPRLGGDPAATFSTTGTVSVAAGHGIGTFTLAVGAFAITNSNPTGAKLSVGSASSYTVIVQAATPPTPDPLSIVAPSDIPGVEGNTTGGATIVLGTATASGGTPPYTITNNALAVFPVGTTTVTWTVDDAAGGSATATQTVTVVDTTPPSITAPVDITVEGNTFGGATGVALGSPTVSDIVDSNPTVTDDAPGFFPLGPTPTTVTWTATDASGNSATATQTVTVVDTTPPVIVASATLPVIVGAPKSVLGGAAIDIVDPAPSLTNNAPDFFPIGTTTVIWTATDATGNEAYFATTVTATYGFGVLSYPSARSVKIGSTLPLKWYFVDYFGDITPSAGAGATVIIFKVSNNTETTDQAVTVQDPGKSGYQYNADSYWHQFNWQTKGLSAGVYYVGILYNGSVVSSTYITLAK